MSVAPGGLGLREAMTVCQTLSRLPLAGMDLILYDPTLDWTRMHAKEIIGLIKSVLAPEPGIDSRGSKGFDNLVGT